MELNDNTVEIKKIQANKIGECPFCDSTKISDRTFPQNIMCCCDNCGAVYNIKLPDDIALELTVITKPQEFLLSK